MEQNNTYMVFDSCGRPIAGLYIIASNINEARKEAMELYKSGKIDTAFFKVKRAYNGGVRGSQC